jgi:hypothetical protein
MFMAQKKPHAEEFKLELPAARVYVWIKIRGKDALDVDKKFWNMSDRALLRRIREAQNRTRVMDAGGEVFIADFRVLPAEEVL